MRESTYGSSTTRPKSESKSRRDLLRTAVYASLGVALAPRLMGSARGSEATTADQDDYDLVVIGSGAAGMTGALTAAKRGLKVLLIEKAPTFGGSLARSGAGIWIRNNEVILKAGVPDSPEQASAYLASVVGDDVPREKQLAFLANGPAMISFVLRHTPLRFRFMEGYSDYYPENPGGLENGSSIEPDVFDGHLLGDELKNLNKPYIALPPGVAVRSGDYKWLTLATVNPQGLAVAAQCAGRYAAALLRGEKPLTMGQALAAGLRVGLLKAKVPVWLNTPLVDLKFDEQGRIEGVIALVDGQETLIRAKRGVLIASGGFEHNAAMRAQYQRQPITTDWTVGAKENTGDGILLGKKAGAALDLMDEAWWGPSIPLPDQPYFCLAERTLPGSILINGKGQRFVNEGAPYSDVVHKMYEDQGGQAAINVWLITDQNYRNRYLFKDILPTLPLPKEWYENGSVFKHKSLEGLAEQIGVPADALLQTIERFNGFAETGIDLDFRRGDSVYDHYYTDPSVKPNSCLGPIKQGPFYAFKIVPGDLGTNGGLKTDARARVLRNDGSVIEGLYAAGNASATVMGRSYAGAGSTIGPAMTFGFIAANDLADRS